MLIPCADWYMEMLEYARDALDGHFYFFIPEFEIWRVTSDKSSFGEMLSRYGISHPKTVVIDSSMKDIEKRFLSLKPPFVLKAADSSEYWRHPFSGMEKVFFLPSADGIKRIAEKIFSSGYSGKLVAQERIERPSKPKMNIFKGKRTDDYDYNAQKKEQNAEVDRILEKLKKNGYSSLTEEEKKRLFDASK